jgi:hypothetical protein
MDPLTEIFKHPLLGLVVGIVATLGALMTAIFGPFKKIRLPVENVPGFSRGILNVVLFAPFVLSFIIVSPQNAQYVLFASLAAMLMAVYGYLKFGRLFATYQFTKPRARRVLWFEWKREETVIGGATMTPEAKAKKKETGQSDQALLASAEYDPDVIWQRSSRIDVQIRIEGWYYAFMLFSVLTVVTAALGAQALLSEEKPFDAVKKEWRKTVKKSDVETGQPPIRFAALLFLAAVEP